MSLKIQMTPIGEKSFNDNIVYLEKRWSKKEVLQFIQLVVEHIEIIQTKPTIFPIWNNSIFRKATIHKRVIMFYSFNDKDLIIHLFWNTWQNPEKIASLIKGT